MDTVICCIAKKETNYIEEWIRYHLKLGFSKIYIFDNSDDFELRDFLSNSKIDFSKIMLIHFPGKGKQLMTYYTFLQYLKNIFHL